MVIVGASGAIGGAAASMLAADRSVRTVHALSRSPIEIDSDKVQAQFVDIRYEDSIRHAVNKVAAHSPIDLVLVATGILHRGDELRPEKAMADLDPERLKEVFEINAVGPVLVAKHFLPKMRRGYKTVFAALSARVGSIADNRLGGWASYRASKASLNMLLKTMAIEHARKRADSIVVSLHPGTVDSPLSRPFSSRVPDAQLFTPMNAAANLLRVIGELTPGDTGGFFAWDGTRIEF